jgi:hypothetical protein
MTNLPRPRDGNGVFESAMAAARSAFTSGRSSTAADGRRMNRVCLPDPTSTFCGSGKTRTVDEAEVNPVRGGRDAHDVAVWLELLDELLQPCLGIVVGRLRS